MCRFFNILVIFLLPFNLCFGQTTELSSLQRKELIENQLSSFDLSKIKSLEKDEVTAKKMMKSSDKYYEEYAALIEKVDKVKDKKSREKLLKKSSKIETKAVKNRVGALRSFHDSYVQRYKLYKTDLKKFFITVNKSLSDSALNLEKKVYNCFEQADLAIQKTYYMANSNEVFKTLTNAYNHQRLGLLYQELLYALFLKWNEKTINQINTEIESILAINPINKYKKKELSTNDSIKLITKVVYDTVKVAHKEDVIIYSVQIAASKKPLSIEQLRNIYPNEDLISYEIENEWYKYKLGQFNYYSDAQKYKMSTGVRDAFIVAYKNGKKVSLKELTSHASFKN